MHPLVIKALLDQGADKEAKCNNGFTALHTASLLYGQCDSLKQLTKAPASCEKNHTTKRKRPRLLKRKAFPSYTRYATPLLNAARNNKIEATKKYY